MMKLYIISKARTFYELLPVNISFQDKHYYLKCYRKIDDVWLIFRIDRMREIESGNVTKRRPPKTEKPFYFSADMYEPERNTIVTLKVKLSMVNDLLEKLGEYAAYSPCRDDKEYGILTVRAGINKSFYLFLLGCGSGVELVSPPEIRAEYLTEVRKMLGAYKEDFEQTNRMSNKVETKKKMWYNKRKRKRKCHNGRINGDAGMYRR